MHFVFVINFNSIVLLVDQTDLNINSAGFRLSFLQLGLGLKGLS